MLHLKSLVWQFCMLQTQPYERRWILLCLLVMLGKCSAAWAEDFFTSRIEPILKKHCYECHSHGSGKMKGGLTLDSRSGWEQGGDHGPAIIPGKPGESLLFHAVDQKTGKLKMPPSGRLPVADIRLLEEWILAGAKDPRKVAVHKGPVEAWWSLKKLEKPQVPKGASHPIDAFIRHKLAARELQPAALADRRTLARRLYLDVTGVPPTWEEMQAFVNSPDDSAYEKLVDKLLASPRYGERWARHWLDTIHFAETHGFEHDLPRADAWRYRDYVIAAFNNDLPWGRFIQEQLAADAFYPDDTSKRVALGFLGAGTFDASSYSTAPKTFEYLDRDDLVHQTMAAFTSTTANCARCHAHKFDPISQEDYYSLQAVFAGIVEGNISFDEDPKIAKERSRLTILADAAGQKDAGVLLAPEYQAVVQNWVDQHQNPVLWHTLEFDGKVVADAGTFKLQQDGSFLVSDTAPEKDTYVLTTNLPGKKWTAFRLEVLAHDSLPKRGPGRQDNGNLHLSEFEAMVLNPGQPSPSPLKISKATADFNQEGWGIDRAIDGKPETAWGIYPQVGKDHQAIFELEQPLPWNPESKLTILLRQLHGGRHLIGRFRLSVTDAPNPSLAALSFEVAAALRKDPSQRSQVEHIAIAAQALKDYAGAELQKLPAQAKVYAAGATSEVLTGLNKGSTQNTPRPRKVEVLRRGDFDKPVKEAHPGALSAIPWLKSRFDLSDTEPESARRVALANWIADANNPLTWRSVANRVWHYHFGQGICDTPSDFGKMGGNPSHPELLDWLACELRDHGGSLKHLHRLILTSHAYKQSSEVNSKGMELDSQNRFLWRQNSQRMDADTYRDGLIAIAGKMDWKMGGPGIRYFKEGKPVQSTPTLDYQVFDWSSMPLHRRSVYRFVWRGIPDPFLEALDFPDLGLLTPRRESSSSALQALALYNNKFVLHFSSELARDVEQSRNTLEDRITALTQRVLLRKPTARELQTFSEYVTRHGLAALCRVLFNSNEYLFVG